MKIVNWNMTRSCYKRVTSGTEMDDEGGGNRYCKLYKNVRVHM